MALPRRQDDYVVLDDDWNAHVDKINDNASRISSLERSNVKCILGLSADQAVPSGSDTVIQWDVTHVDTAGIKNGNEVIVPAGDYFIFAETRFPSDGTGNQRVGYLLDWTDGAITSISTQAKSGLIQPPNSAGGAGNIMAFGRGFHLTGPQPLVVAVYHDADTSLNLSATDWGGTWLTVYELPTP